MADLGCNEAAQNISEMCTCDSENILPSTSNIVEETFQSDYVVDSSNSDNVQFKEPFSEATDLNINVDKVCLSDSTEASSHCAEKKANIYETENLINRSVWDSEETVLPSLGILPEDENSIEQNTNESDSSFSCSTTNRAITTSSVPPECPSETAYKMKKIAWKDIEVPIITQNTNGPCPLIAILNAMVLKGDISLPSDRCEILGGELVSLIGNALFDLPRKCVSHTMRMHLEKNTEDAVNILHKLLTGLDVNIKFSGVSVFEFTPELSIFDVLGVSLYHGWVVDPASEAASLISNMSYNQLTNDIILWREQASRTTNNDSLVKAMLCEEFIASSLSQLTIHGLFELGRSLSEGEVSVFFRNNHFSTIYKYKGQLYQLLTDQGFLNEEAVWETLTDVDSTFSEFVTAAFKPLQASGETDVNMTREQQIDTDQQLAVMLQHQADKQRESTENFEKMVTNLGLSNLSDEEMARRLQEEENKAASEEISSQTHEEHVKKSTRLPPAVVQLSQYNVPSVNDEKKKKDCAIL